MNNINIDKLHQFIDGVYAIHWGMQLYIVSKLNFKVWGDKMRLIALGKVVKGKCSYTRFIDFDTHNIYDVAVNENSTLKDKTLINCRVTDRNKLIPTVGSYKPSLLNTDTGERVDVPTLIYITDDLGTFGVSDVEGKITELTLDEYKELHKKSKINNEIIHSLDKEYLCIKRYVSDDYDIINNVSKIPIGEANKQDKPVTEEVKDKQPDEVNTKLEQNNATSHIDTVENNGNSRTDNKYISIDEIESKENNCNNDIENKCTYESESEAADDINDINYQEVVWNMYPMDVLTITAKDFEIFSYKILRVLDSDLDNSNMLHLSLIFKQTKNKCTFALIRENKNKKLVTIQVLGQSDISEKALEADLETLCKSYAMWLRNTKFIKI